MLIVCMNAKINWNLDIKLTLRPMFNITKNENENINLMVWVGSGLVYSMAQASKAILPKDVGGPWGKRIGVSVGGSMSWGLVVGAYVTGRVNPSDWNRYSLVVLNW